VPCTRHLRVWSNLVKLVLLDLAVVNELALTKVPIGLVWFNVCQMRNEDIGMHGSTNRAVTENAKFLPNSSSVFVRSVLLENRLGFVV